MTQFSWNDRENIAKALLQTYPETERQELSLDALRTMVVALPCFGGPPQPPRHAHLESILWTWMRLADQDGADGESAYKGSA